jgi:hypothetical protein
MLNQDISSCLSDPAGLGKARPGLLGGFFLLDLSIVDRQLHGDLRNVVSASRAHQSERCICMGRREFPAALARPLLSAPPGMADMAALYNDERRHRRPATSGGAGREETPRRPDTRRWR